MVLCDMGILGKRGPVILSVSRKGSVANFNQAKVPDHMYLTAGFPKTGSRPILSSCQGGGVVDRMS